jgi:hypothetical protein
MRGHDAISACDSPPLLLAHEQSRVEVVALAHGALSGTGVLSLVLLQQLWRDTLQLRHRYLVSHRVVPNHGERQDGRDGSGRIGRHKHERPPMERAQVRLIRPGWNEVERSLPC